ncbi:MAG: hypothetical protein HGA49_08295 [Eubacteriaceae bacterium]|nr:hypothetical protein [Eubacteriaceae bacterium]
MKEIIVLRENFEFEEFVEHWLEFAEQVVNPGYEVCWVSETGCIPEYEVNHKKPGELIKHLEQGKALFFIFTATNTGEPIKCGDGNDYELDEESEFYLTDADCVGYLMQIIDGHLTINSAVNSGGGCITKASSIDITPDCDIFEDPLEEYIIKFINE